jgi:hypothetical protein
VNAERYPKNNVDSIAARIYLLNDYGIACGAAISNATTRSAAGRVVMMVRCLEVGRQC